MIGMMLYLTRMGVRVCMGVGGGVGGGGVVPVKLLPYQASAQDIIEQSLFFFF